MVTRIKRPKISEDQLQSSIVSYVKQCCPDVMVFCSLNGVYLGSGNKSFIYMQKLKNMGLAVGEPDLRLHWGKGNTLFLECKIGHNRPTENQINCMTNLTNIGSPCEVVYSLEDAIKIMKLHGVPNRERA